jgi:hypothetical protein
VSLRGDRQLEKALRANRPEPSDGFLQLAAGKIEAESTRRRNRRPVLEPLVILVAGGSLVAFFLAFGSFSSLRSSVLPGGQPFAAANVAYATPILTCTISKDNGNHVTVSGTSTLAQGTISVVFSSTQSPQGDYPQTEPSFAATLSWGPIVSTGNTHVSNGDTYTATVTQSGSDFPTGSTTCSFVGS